MQMKVEDFDTSAEPPWDTEDQRTRCGTAEFQQDVHGMGFPGLVEQDGLMSTTEGGGWRYGYMGMKPQQSHTKEDLVEERLITPLSLTPASAQSHPKPRNYATARPVIHTRSIAVTRGDHPLENLSDVNSTYYVMCEVSEGAPVMRQWRRRTNSDDVGGVGVASAQTCSVMLGAASSVSERGIDEPWELGTHPGSVLRIPGAEGAAAHQRSR
ncbi:hypothetical protein B0H17DRAFT_1150242 [Mycena rosella]|uniref:Uncharacterized protein n=1 Tax=Mycena rosella TaxID=1033263 RepID=A0AAD7BVC2_MYCRO|nr:hypothetical protein B0H17DRAFT_1150242 [Mycena rosella]